MRKLYLLIFLTAFVLGGWWLYRYEYATVPVHEPLRSPAELEELTYQRPFDASLALELGRACWRKFESAMETDGDAASEALSSYLIAYVESGYKQSVRKEFEEHLLIAAQLAGVPKSGESDAVPMMIELYKKGTRPSVEFITNVRYQFDEIWQANQYSPGSTPVQAKAATERNIRAAFDVAIGRKRLPDPKGGKGNFYFTPSYWKRWAKAMEGYGVIYRLHNGGPFDEFMMKDELTSPIGVDAIQLVSGDTAGRFVSSDGEIVPGLLYFRTLATSASASDGQMNSPRESVSRSAPTTEADPADVYRRVLKLRDLGEFAELYEFYDEDTQKAMINQINQTMSGLLQDDHARQRLAQMGGRDLFVLMCKSGTTDRIQVLSEEVNGDTAVVHTSVKKDGSEVPTDVQFVRVNGQWKMHW